LFIKENFLLNETQKLNIAVDKVAPVQLKFYAKCFISAIALSVIMLSVIVTSVAAPNKQQRNKKQISSFFSLKIRLHKRKVTPKTQATELVLALTPWAMRQ
jgi:hypothetical protein